MVPRVVSPKKGVGSKMYKGRCSEKLIDKTWPKVGSNWSDSRKGTRVVGPKLPINVIILCVFKHFAGICGSTDY